MKKILQLLSVFMLLALLWTCSKSNGSGSTGGIYRSNGVITGFDYNKCKCCGGYQIEINGKQYLFSSIPSGSLLKNFVISYPFPVTLDWKKDTSSGCSDRITVLDIEPRGYTHSIGYITGFDEKACACCGGTYIEINGVARKFWDWPQDSLWKKKLPYKVSLDWTRANQYCGFDSFISAFNIKPVK